eukprot:7131763-Pyramimonas_sp.AAC.1
MPSDLDEAVKLLPHEAIRDVAANLGLFSDAEAVTYCCAIDMNELRSKARGVCCPPPDLQEIAVPPPP